MSRPARRAGAALATAACTVAVVAAVAGCGSDSLSDSQLHSRATRICTRASRRTDSISSPTMPTGGAKFIGAGIAALHPELTALRRLRAPSDMADPYRDALDASARELDALRSTLHGLRDGNDPVVAIKTLQQELAPVELRAENAWSALNLPACQDAT